MKQFEVKMKCVVYKTITFECETEDQARGTPWELVVDELETGMEDWDVLSVKEAG